MTKAEIDTLFAQTLRGDYDDEEPWEAVCQLRSHGCREIFDRAASWCSSDSPLKRARAAAILCQLRREQAPGEPWKPGEFLYRDESYLLVSEMLAHESEPQVIDSAVHALGHIDNVAAVQQIVRFQDHPDENVRFAVACALGCFPNEAQSIQGLLALTRDQDSDVRDWAVFGLGVMGDADSPAIREALLGCLDDSNPDVREEAACGLGKRRDLRVLPKLLEMLLDDDGFSMAVEEAATSLLGLEEKDTKESGQADFKAALQAKFKPADS